MECLEPVPMYHRGFHPSGKPRYSLAPSPSAIDDSPSILVPCGKCLACKFNRRRQWSDRIISETWLHDHSSFVTLTFNDDHLPSGIPSKSLVQKFLKRFRKFLASKCPSDFKYFIVLEFGTKTHRPHFHGVFFGVNFLDDIWDPRIATISDGHPIYTSSVLESIWQQGFVSVDNANSAVANYVTKYVLKTLDCDDLWFMFSRNIGLRNFVVDGHLTDFAVQAAQLGYYHIGDFGHTHPTALPRAVLRVLESQYPDLYNFFKLRKLSFAKSAKTDTRSSGDRLSVLKYRNITENSKRKLDNE